MKFEIKELTNNKLNYFEININKDCVKCFKHKMGNINAISINFEALNLGQKLYGNSKKQSVEIQKANAKKMNKIFKTCVSVLKLMKRNKISFDNVFYVSGLKRKNLTYAIIISLFSFFCAVVFGCVILKFI